MAPPPRGRRCRLLHTGSNTYSAYLVFLFVAHGETTFGGSSSAAWARYSTHPWSHLPTTTVAHNYLRCSGGEVIGSISSDTLAEDSVSFAVGITSIWTTVEGYFLPFLEDVYIGGYDLDFGGTGVSYSLKGLLG